MLGSDHLASLLPCIIGQQWLYGCKIGCIWGFGHGITSFIIGIIGFSLKDIVFQSNMNYILCIKNIALGGTLLVIGTMGMREAIHNKLEEDEKEKNNESEGKFVKEKEVKEQDELTLNSIVGVNVEDDVEDEEINHNNNFKISNIQQEKEEKEEQEEEKKILQPTIKGLSRRHSLYLTYFFNGCIMGLTWDGLPSLAPSIALPEFSSVLIFLFCYCFGTAFFMSIVSGIVSHASIILGDIVGSNFPLSLALLASIVSIVTGCYWLLYAGIVAVVGDDETLIPYHMYFSCIAIICSGISSMIVIYTYIHNSLFGASILSPILYYWKILVYNDYLLWNSSNMTINKSGVHTV